MRFRRRLDKVSELISLRRLKGKCNVPHISANSGHTLLAAVFSVAPSCSLHSAVTFRTSSNWQRHTAAAKDDLVAMFVSHTILCREVVLSMVRVTETDSLQLSQRDSTFLYLSSSPRQSSRASWRRVVCILSRKLRAKNRVGRSRNRRVA